MAVLCDSELLATLDAGQLEIDPKPPVDHFTPCSIDLTLGVEFKRWKPAGGITIDPADPKFSFAQVASSLLEPMSLDGTGAVVINPQEFLLGITHERVHLPSSSRLCARVEGRSTLARLGLGVHVTAPTIHAGWNGKIALEQAPRRRQRSRSDARVSCSPRAAVCDRASRRVESWDELFVASRLRFIVSVNDHSL